MSPLDAFAAIFWACLVLVAYAYVGYPMVILALSRLLGRRGEEPAVAGDELPTISLLLAAYNEEAVIEGWLQNALAMDYPAEKVEVVVGSDGSSDGTAAIVRRFVDRGVKFLDFSENRGKATVLNAAAAEARGEILVMSDANTIIDPRAPRQLARWFGSPRIGAAVGRLVLIDPKTGGNADSLYWKYETFLKKCEGRLGGLLGANGAIYAIRRGLYAPIPAETIVDDFVIPLLAKQRTGCEIVYDCSAVAHEETPPDVGAEFHRRARIGAGGFQSIGMLWRLLDPRQGWVAFTFLSHKILRWLCPFFLLGALASNLALAIAGSLFFQVMLALQVAFYATSVLLAFVPTRARLLKPLRLTTMFTGMNAALLVGFWRWLLKTQKGTWRRTVRPT